jgi:tetratricopeptide (TPR) repeat protein
LIYKSARSTETERRLSGQLEEMSTSVLYNLARIYKDLNDDAKAMEAYEKLLDRHPEYVDGT